MNNTSSNCSSSNVTSDQMDGLVFGAPSTAGGAGLNFGIKDSRFDDSISSPGLMFNAKQVNAAIQPSPPKEAGIGQILTTLHLEWRKHETERCRWSAEKAEYDAKIAIIEGRLKSYANANSELLQRIKMLESALLVARSQQKFGDESVVDRESAKALTNDYQPPKSIYTHDQIKRGRHLLQQYLKEIQTFDEAILSKNENEHKIVDYLLRTSAGGGNAALLRVESPSDTPQGLLKSGYDSTKKSKTFGHPDSKYASTNSITKPMSVEESTKFLGDLRKGYKHTASERQQRESSNKAFDRGDSRSTNEPNNFNAVEMPGLHVSAADPQGTTDATNSLLDLLNSLGGYSTNPALNNDADDVIDIMNFPDSSDNSNSSAASPSHLSKATEMPPGIFPSAVGAVSGGGVVRKKISNKKPRMKIDMLNFGDDVLSGTSSALKKSDHSVTAAATNSPSKASVAAATGGGSGFHDNSGDFDDLNATFETKLDLLAKRFNVRVSDASSSTYSDDLASLSSNVSASVDNEAMSNDFGGVDLGILNEIDSLISTHDESSTLLSASNDDISADLKSATVQKHWTINSVLRGHNDSVTCVNFHHNEKIAASASLDGLVGLWYYNDKEKSDMYPTQFLRGHEYPVLCCLFNTIGDCLYTSDCQGNILVWNVLNNGSLICGYKAHQEAIWHLNHCHSTNTLMSASADGVLSLWKPDSTTAVDSFTIKNSKGDPQMGVISADFSPLDSSKVIVSAADTVVMYDVNSGTNVFELKLDDNYVPTMSSSSGLIQSSCVHPSMNMYATGWGHNQVRIADLTSGQFVHDFIAHPAPITALSFGNSCSGTFLATAGANGSIHMWSNSYSCYQDVPPHRVKHHSGVNSLCFHSTYPHMITGGADELVKLYI